MDPSLIKEREKFKKRALASATTKEKVSQSQKTTIQQQSAKYDPFKNTTSSTLDEYSNLYYNATLSQSSLGSGTYSTHKFNVLAKVVKHLKERFLNGYSDFLTVDEILEEMRLSDLSSKLKQWLENEALPNNPKVKVSTLKSQDGSSKYMFKAPLDIRDRRSLLKLLAHRDEHGLGAVTVDEVEESLPHAARILQQIEGSVIFLTRPGDKKRIIFHNDESCNFKVHPDFVKMWRNANVDNIDDTKIEEYLRDKGLNAIKTQSQFPTDKTAAGRKNRRRINRSTRAPKPLSMKFNEHMAGVLQDYTLGKK